MEKAGSSSVCCGVVTSYPRAPLALSRGSSRSSGQGVEGVAFPQPPYPLGWGQQHPASASPKQRNTSMEIVTSVQIMDFAAQSVSKSQSMRFSSTQT